MNTKVCIQFLVTQNKLSKLHKKRIEHVIRKHSKKAGTILGIKLVNVTVYPNANFVIPEIGSGGYSGSNDWLQIYIDTTKNARKMRRIIDKSIPGTIYHEMNHVARWGTVGYGKSLLEAIITEGLANVFEEQYWKEYKVIWASYESKEINKLLAIIRKRDKRKDNYYNHDEWFHGSGKLPRWIGYKIGTFIVRSFLEYNPGIKWRELIGMDSDEIIKKSKVSLS